MEQFLENRKHSQSSYMSNEASAERNWWIVDASNQTVGRIATHIATLLRGKHKPTFTPHSDTGDFVIVINTDKLKFTGSKWIDKKYYRHSRFFGSLKQKSAEQMLAQDSGFIMSEAVRGMLPDNRSSYAFMKKLKTFKDANHDHASQKPQAFQIKH
jgi:large subunit ribosomal protein L13